MAARRHPETTDEKKPSPRGELRRRWRAFMEDGSMGRLGSEGRLMALYVLLRADFEKCTVRLSARGAARLMSVGVTTARRGVSQLVEAGILELLAKGEGSTQSTYGFLDPDTPRVRPGHEACAQRAPVVCAPDTPRVRSAHKACAQRAPVVCAARTPGVRITRFPLGTSISTNVEINQSNQPGSGGDGPPDRAMGAGA